MTVSAISYLTNLGFPHFSGQVISTQIKKKNQMTNTIEASYVPCQALLTFNSLDESTIDHSDLSFLIIACAVSKLLMVYKLFPTLFINLFFYRQQS